MTRNKKKKKEKNKKPHPETKGLFLLAFDILFFLSLISFSYNNVSENFLGIIGYSMAWITFATVGLGGYVISIFIAWAGWKYLSSSEIINLKVKTLCFTIFLICLCMLLNIFAELYPAQSSFFSKKVFTETIYLTAPYPHFYTRYNLGGIPLYFIYKDLPLINLEKLLSNIGVVILFSIGAILSFILLSKIRIVPQGKILFSNIKRLFGKIFNPDNWFNPFKKLTCFFINSLKRKKEPSKISTVTNIKIASNENVSNPIIRNKTINSDDKIDTKVIISRESGLTDSKSFSFKQKKISNYILPSPSLLTSPPVVDAPQLKKELSRQAEILEATLNNFGIQAKVGEINCGPTITSFEVHPSIGVKVQKIKTLEKDIALNLEAKSIRIIAPIPGKAAVGVEIPSIHPQQVSLKEMLHYHNQVKKKQTIPLLLGKTVSGDHVITDLAKMPHLLIAGATGSGKSVCINTIVMSILMNLSPDEIRLIMIDPKKVELTQYSNLPHMIAPVVTEAHGAYAALQWLVQEMQKRYEILKQLGLRNISAFNNRKRKIDFEESLNLEIPDKMQFIVAIVDEFADLMMVSSTDLETPIARIAQMARAVGIHLILATQRPSREVITGIIKANFPSRIAFKVASRINSQIILDETGAESLLGNGDLLFLPPGSSQLVRAQGAYISDDDISSIVTDIYEKNPPSFLIPSFDAMSKANIVGEDENTPRDALYDQALTTVLQAKNASTTFLQRKLKIGYARAASLIDELEENKIIGPQDGSKPRRILTDISILDSD